MSVFSGKCDLFDHMSGLGGWFNEDGKPVEFGDKDTPRYFSDEYKDFLEFKRRTNGTLHQHKKIEVTNDNLKFIKEHCKEFDYTKYAIRVEDKRVKEGHKYKHICTYEYWGTEYTSLKELNKKGVYITIDIHFDTILDLIPYYPYIVSASFTSTNDDGTKSAYVVISKEPFPIRERDEFLQNGWNNCWESYARRLQEHYIEVVLKYFNKGEKDYETNGNTL